MNHGLLASLKRALNVSEKLHPTDARLAKNMIKRNLASLFPHLKGNPEALEKAYDELRLEPRLGSEFGDPPAYYEVCGPFSDW